MLFYKDPSRAFSRVFLNPLSDSIGWFSRTIFGNFSGVLNKFIPQGPLLSPAGADPRSLAIDEENPDY